jgi:cytochrome c-type biogenesis protein CcmH
MRGARLALGVVIGLSLVAGGGPARAQQPATHVAERDVYEIAARLRCVVCQNLSVADSPSEMASQMRAVIRDRLAAGERPDQVVQYFVDKYGEWILLEPPRRGFNLVVWVLPPVAVALGVVVAAVLVARWSRRSPTATAPEPELDPALRDRIRREVEATE